MSQRDHEDLTLKLAQKKLQSLLQTLIILSVTKDKLSRFLNSMASRVFYGWWIILLGSLIQAVGTGILYHSFTVFFLPLKRDLNVSSAAISLIYGAARLEGGLEGPIVGHLIDRFGPRMVVIFGAGLAGIGLILLSTVHTYWAFFFIFIFVVSLGYNAGFFHPISTAVNSWFIRRRAVGFSIISASGSIGGMVMAPLLSYFILNYGWRTGSIIAGFLILAIALPAAWPIHRSPEVLGLYPDGRLPPGGKPNDSSQERTALADVDFTIKEALRTLNYWLLTLGITLRLLVTVALTVHLVPILVWKGMSEATSAYLVSLFAFGTIVTTLLIGWLGDRWNKALLSSAGIIPTMVGMIGLLVIQNRAALYALPIGLAITMGSVPLNWALIGDFFGRRSYATLRGIMGVGYGLGTFLSPIYAGWVFDRTGSYTTVLLTFSIIHLVAVFLFAQLYRRSSVK